MLHRHVPQQFLQPRLPLVDAVEQQGGSWVEQSHRGVAVQLLQTSVKGPTALLQQRAQLRLQALALADQVGLAGVLQKGRGWNITGRTWSMET